MAAVASMRKFGLSPVGVRLISTTRINEFRPPREKEAIIARKDKQSILADEAKGVFRVLDIVKSAVKREEKRVQRSTKLADKRGPDRAKSMIPDQDWNSVWPAARTFHPASVPLPVRQGVTVIKTQVKRSKYANTELMKIPNFLHLTPPVVRRHCAAIKQFCTPFPKQLDSDEKIEQHFPVKVITSSYLNSDSSIRDRRSRVVVYTFKLSSLELDKHARDKMIRLLGDKYNAEDDTVTLESDRCPYRGQNLDYTRYLVTALFFESWRTEDWELAASGTRQQLDLHSYTAPDTDPQDFRDSLEKVLNDGEDEESLREYKEAARRLLNLPAEDIKAEIV